MEIDEISEKYNSAQGNLLIDFLFEFGKFTKTINKKCIKLQDVITKIGGVLNSIMLVAYFLGNIVSKFDHYFTIYSDYDLIFNNNLII